MTNDRPNAGSRSFVTRSPEHRVTRGTEPAGALLAGIVSGEGLASYLTVRDTTPDGYWVAQLAVGVVLGILVARRTRLLGTTAGFLVGVGALLVTRVVPMYGA